VIELIMFLSWHPHIRMMILDRVGERIAGPDRRWALNVYSWSRRDLYRLVSTKTRRRS
jgi:hypothetical protein